MLAHHGIALLFLRQLNLTRAVIHPIQKELGGPLADVWLLTDLDVIRSGCGVTVTLLVVGNCSH